MAQIVRVPGFGENLGTSIGTGISQGISNLLEMKLKDRLKSQELGRVSLGLQGLGYSPQESQQLSKLEPSILKELIKQNIPAREEGQIAQLEEETLGLNTKQQQGVFSSLDRLEPNVSQQEIVEPRSFLQPRSPEGEQIPEIANEPPKQPIYKPTSPGFIMTEEKSKLDKKLEDLRISPIQREKLRKRFEKRADDYYKKQVAIDKKQEKYLDKLSEEREGARTGDMRLDRMEELIRSSKLNNPATASAVEWVGKIPWLGIDISGILTPQSQEFRKLSKDFLKDVKKIFGARVTTQEVNNFLQTVPTLLQSDEGKMAVIRNMRLFNTAANLRSAALDEIQEANAGYIPHNVEQLVEKRVKPKLDKIAREFATGKTRFSWELPEGLD